MTIIRVVDLETTGFTPPAAVCDIGWVDIVSTKADLAGDPCEWEAGAIGSALVNPGLPIPPETSAIHHIVDADVAEAIGWGAARSMLASDAACNVFAAHNAKFERQWISDDVVGGRPWICTYKCALRLWPEAPAHSNQALRYWRGLNVDRALADFAHRAGPDAYVTAHLLSDMLAQPGISVPQLIEWSTQPALLAKCHMGSWRGRRWAEIDEVGFLTWILNRDFDEDVMHTAKFYRDKLLAAEQVDDGMPF